MMDTPQIVAILGGQWGDEGKGKVVDFAAGCFDMTARATGGNNAGHTIYISGKKHVFNLIPSSITWGDVVSYLGNGMVVDPFTLVREINSLAEKGFQVNNLWLSGNAHVIMLYHNAHDHCQECGKGENKLGTTRKGIGPTYADKLNRVGIRVNDLLDKRMLREKMIFNIREKFGMFTHIYCRDKAELLKVMHDSLPKEPFFDEYRENIRAMGGDPDIDAIAETLVSMYFLIGKRIKQYVTDVSKSIESGLGEGKTLLLEGAQGLLLDIDHGTYPFVTSSNPSVGGLKSGLGISRIDKVYSLIKAYTTRVGSGPFPTELLDGIGEYFREKGQEYGATTGRPRRCGWHDSVLTRYTSRINGPDIIITKLDILTGMNNLRICNSYRYTGPNRMFNGEMYFSGKIVRDFPSDSTILEHCVPEEWVDVEGWSEDISGVRSFADLPANARKYLKMIEDLGNVRIALISVSHERDDMIIVPGRWNLARKSRNEQAVIRMDSAKPAVTEKAVRQERRYKAIIYDLDNTLVATNDFVLRLMNRTAEVVSKSVRFRVPQDFEIKEVQRKNLPFEEMFEVLFPDPEGHHGDHLAKIILEKYREAAKGLPYSATPDGVAVWNEVKKEGISELIVTNRIKMAKERLTEAGYPEVSLIFAPESKDDQKPSPAAFKGALTTLEARGIRKSEVLSVGDHIDDYIASKRAGIEFVAVLTGATTQKEFELSGLDSSMIIPGLSEIRRFI